jgi:hypothetical protein
MAKYKVWQVGWEHEAKTVEVEEEDGGGGECPSCECFQPHPNQAEAGSVVCAYRLETPAESPVAHRHMAPFFGSLGWVCRKATPEEIAGAEYEAKDLQSGKTQEIPPATPEEILRRDAIRKSLAGTAKEAFEMFTNPAAWAAKRGAELGAKMRAKKEAERDHRAVQQCTCGRSVQECEAGPAKAEKTEKAEEKS